jgi:adenylate cyclase, class 2
MEIEYEATYINVNKEEVRERLKKAKALLIHPEFLQKRYVFDLPEKHGIKGGWVRIRQEWDKKTLSVKIVDGETIKDQREVCLEINDIDKAQEILELLGCLKKSYQENKRELWKLDDVEVTIDEWPFLESFVEVEGDSEEKVKKASQELGFDYQTALFCSIDWLYQKKYGLSLDIINNQTPRIVFNEENPFEKWLS